MGGFHFSAIVGQHEKAAGRAGTLLSGAFHSWTAIFHIYGIEESGASAKSAGGAK
jgi:hypothetical protein